MALTRITITLPKDLLVAADRRARDLDRPRSWVLVEALREYLREPERRAHAAGLGEQRLQQLEADLSLTAEQRVLAAEETARVAEHVRPARPNRNRVIQFDRYEDYLEWKRREALGL